MDTQEAKLWALSAIDGRYKKQVEVLSESLSEAALIKARIHVELAWLLHLSEDEHISKFLSFPSELRATLSSYLEQLPDEALIKVKAYEATTNHDVKAVEYYVRELLELAGASKEHSAYIHFACTSEDINNTSYALMLKNARNVVAGNMKELLQQIADQIESYSSLGMLSRTHGQTASPTSLGKELGVFAYRLNNVYQRLIRLEIPAKMNGAVGNYNAHVCAFPEVDWPKLSRDFVEKSLGLDFNPMTTQIENHDGMVEIVEAMRRFNTILIGFSRDLWSYISIDYFKLALKADEVGSSTMPHKVNPIDFENAEGNLGVANALASHFSDKLPISRWQRDLSDSTVQRVLGTFFGHSLLAYKAFQRGFSKLEANESAIKADLSNAWEVLAEAIQTLMRKRGVMDAYERLKAATRGRKVDAQSLHALIRETEELSNADKQFLLELTPDRYTGIAEKLALDYASELRHALR